MHQISSLTRSYNPYAQNNSNNKSSSNIISATINEFMRNGARTPFDNKTAFELLQKISTNLENAKFGSLSSLVKWTIERPNDNLSLPQFLYKVFDGHEANVGADRLYTVQKFIEDALNDFTTRQGGAFEIREYHVLGRLLEQCSMSELLAFAECNIKPGVHPADATQAQLFFNWLVDLKQHFGHSTQPVSGTGNSTQINSEPAPVPYGFDNHWIPKIRAFVSSAHLQEVNPPGMLGLDHLIAQVKIDYQRNNNGEISNERLWQLFQAGGLANNFIHYFR